MPDWQPDKKHLHGKSHRCKAWTTQGQHANDERLSVDMSQGPVVQAVQDGCGIASNEGKTRVYSHAGGELPPGIAELGADVWRGNKPSSGRGLKVLGPPTSHPHFMPIWAESKMLLERELLSQLPRLPSTYNVRGSSSLCVPRRGPTTRSARCRRAT